MVLVANEGLVLSDDGSPVFVQTLSNVCLGFVVEPRVGKECAVGGRWAVGHGPFFGQDNLKT